MFGKTVGEYLRFQRVVLALIVLAWVVRLALSLGRVERRRPVGQRDRVLLVESVLRSGRLHEGFGATSSSTR